MRQQTRFLLPSSWSWRTPLMFMVDTLRASIGQAGIKSFWPSSLFFTPDILIQPSWPGSRDTGKDLPVFLL